jgi:phosphopantetheine--protein transferase-like protein
MIGVDLVYIPDFVKQMKLGGESFLAKAFTAEELKNRDANHLAGIWAAKEATFKASSNSKLRAWNEVNITWEESGKPKSRFDDVKYEISISQHGDYAVAVAIGENSAL